MDKNKSASPEKNGSLKEWTVLVYMSSDNSLGSECVWALTEIQQSELGESLAVVAQFDPPVKGVGTKRYDFSGLGSTPPAIPLPEARIEDYEVDNFADALAKRNIFLKPEKRKLPAFEEENFADYKVLAQFVEKGIERYPANHYIVVLSGFGNGVTGGMLTDDSPGSAMTTPELKKALELVRENQSRFLAQAPEGKIDILGMDSCLMAMVEVASELSGTDKAPGPVRYLVASSGLTPANGWPYRRILEMLNADPQKKPVEVASAIVDNHVGFYADYLISGVSVDQSVCDLNKVAGVEKAVQKLVNTLTTIKAGQVRLNPKTSDAVTLAHWKAQSYRFDQHTDLWDFCDCLAASSTNQAVKKACQEVQHALKACVVKAAYVGAAFQYSHGLSLYFPWAFSELSTIREYRKLAFARRTGWGKFLEAYVKETQRVPRGGINLAQMAQIFPHDGYFNSRDNPRVEDVKDDPRVGDVKDDPRVGDVKDDPRVGDVKDDPRVGDVKDDPRVGDVKDSLLGGASGGIVVFAPKVKNPPTYFYKHPRSVKKVVPKKAVSGKKKT